MTTNTRAEAFAPATMANLGVGFDILGLAIAEMGDTVSVEKRPAPGIVIQDIEGDGGALPREAEKNTAAVAAAAVLRIAGASFGLSMMIKKGLPLASGLGSSAASAVAAAVAVNALLEKPLSRPELLPACLEAEALVSGYHADNVGPSLLGGITLITGTAADQIQHLPVPDNLHLALVTPDVAVPTAEARAVLPKMVSLHDMVLQTGAVARLIDALHRGDVPAAAAAMEADGIVEPARAHLMPLLSDIRATAKKSGALGLVISGAGPTLSAICDSASTAQTVADAMATIYTRGGIKSQSRAARISLDGAKILSVQ